MSLGGRQFVGSSVERDRCVPDILTLASSAHDAICSNGRSGLTPRSVARAERPCCWRCPHSAAQASQISAQTLQSSWANCELDESKLAQTEHTGAHSWHKRIDPAILEGSLRASSTQAEHQCRHWRHASIARSMSVLGAVLAMKISPFERHV